MNAIKYDSDDNVLIGVLIWFIILSVLILTPYILGGLALKKNAKLEKRVARLERLIENGYSTNQIQRIEQ